MPTYRVMKLWEVNAPDRMTALETANTTAPLVSMSYTLPHNRFAAGVWFQDQALLNLVWDFWEGLNLGYDGFADYEPPKFVDMALKGLTPQHLSRLFDLAITAYLSQVPADPQASPPLPGRRLADPEGSPR